jgi:hypothetical protein
MYQQFLQDEFHAARRIVSSIASLIASLIALSAIFAPCDLPPRRQLPHRRRLALARTETVDVVKRTFGTAAQLMYEYPTTPTPSPPRLQRVDGREVSPEMNDQIKQRIKEGRWEIVGGMWVEPDLNMPDGESLVRQLLVGKRWFKSSTA